MLGRFVRYIFKPLVTLLMILAIAFAFFTSGIRIFGLQLYTVLSPSMEPLYHPGTLLYLKDADPSTLQVGDVITFRVDEKTVATHRIVEVVNDSTLFFRTKGDVNQANDTNPVYPEDLLGVPAFHIHYLGYLANYVQEPPGSYYMIIVYITIVFLVVITDIWGNHLNKKDAKEPETDPTNRKENEA